MKTGLVGLSYIDIMEIKGGICLNSVFGRKGFFLSLVLRRKRVLEEIEGCCLQCFLVLGLTDGAEGW